MKIIARSSVRRFFFAPSLLSLMIPRLLFLQIRFFFSITLHSMRIRSFRCPYCPVGWESQPDRYDAVRFQFPFRYLLRRIGRHALFSSDGLSFRGRQLSLQVRYRTILTIHTLIKSFPNVWTNVPPELTSSNTLEIQQIWPFGASISLNQSSRSSSSLVFSCSEFLSENVSGLPNSQNFSWKNACISATIHVLN